MQPVLESRKGPAHQGTPLRRGVRVVSNQAKLGKRANLNSIKAMVGVILREADEEVKWLLEYQLMEDVALYYAPPEVTKVLETLIAET
jgi:hypothetical protein